MVAAAASAARKPFRGRNFIKIFLSDYLGQNTLLNMLLRGCHGGETPVTGPKMLPILPSIRNDCAKPLGGSF